MTGLSISGSKVGGKAEKEIEEESLDGIKDATLKEVAEESLDSIKDATVKEAVEEIGKKAVREVKEELTDHTDDLIDEAAELAAKGAGKDGLDA